MSSTCNLWYTGPGLRHVSSLQASAHRDIPHLEKMLRPSLMNGLVQTMWRLCNAMILLPQYSDVRSLSPFGLAGLLTKAADPNTERW